MVKKYQMYINGKWVDSENKETIDSINPYNQEVWATIPLATDKDVESALEAANTAFSDNWKHTSGKDRASLLLRLADLIDEHAPHLASIESTDIGKIIRESNGLVHFTARNYRYFAGYADKLQGNVVPMDNSDLLDYTIIEPLGVAVLITAWNTPLNILANKLAPALATGNTVIIKPSEFASASTLEFGKLIEKAGFPAGVVNIVTGDGKVGSQLTSSTKINKISFTGGISTAKHIIKSTSENLVPVTTELGGKSPNIIFEDASIEAAVTGAIAGIFGGSGQACIAGSRVLIQESIYDEVVTKIVNKAQSIRLGNPMDPNTEMGPLSNKGQFDKTLSMIDQAKEEGARVLLGGKPSEDPELQNGYFVEPTILGDLDNKMTICQEEVFGPVMSILKFKDEEDAIRIANDSKYGLASGIWTNNLKRAHRVAKRIEAGTVWINTYRSSGMGAPFGGKKLSGHGKERSWHSLLEFTNVKNIMLDLSEDERDPFVLKV